MKHEEYVSAMIRASQEPNEKIREALITALCNMGVVKEEKNENYPTLPKTKKFGASGRTKYLTPDQQLKKRQGWIGEIVTWEDTGAVYQIVGADWRGFTVKYLKGGIGVSNLKGLKAAGSMTKAEQAIKPGVKQSNPRKWRLADGRTVQKRLEDDNLAHPVYGTRS